MIEFALVPAHMVAAEIAPNVERHHAEMNEGDDYGALNIDWDTYIQGSLDGRVKVLTARNDGKLIGYIIFTLGRNMRHKHVIEAQASGWYVEKEHRGRVSLDMLEKADECLHGIGVHRTDYILGDEAAAKLLQRKGYNSNYKVWSKNYHGQ